MAKSTDIRICDVSWETEKFAYRTPIKFGGRIVNDAVLFHVKVKVETRDGRQGDGLGSMPLGNVWAWPSDQIPGEQTFQMMEELAKLYVKCVAEITEYGHPLEIVHLIEQEYQAIAQRLTSENDLPESIPLLAQLVSASPLDASIHDAYGKALGVNSYNTLGSEFVNLDMSHYLTDDFKGEYLDQYTLRTPKKSLPLYHLVGALDPLTESDIKDRINDGLPENLGEWILADGLTHLKIKLNGDNLDWDVDRVLAIDQVTSAAQEQRNVTDWYYSTDFNEKCKNVEYVLEFLHRVKDKSKPAFDRIQYIEQPTARDLKANPENKMHEAAKIKPVVIDESLVSLESLELSRELGYSGIALKACKGQSGALLMGAMAQKHNLFLCVQDLTCVGASFLHSATLSARIPTVAAIEGNGRQYCPAGNDGWKQKYPGMFELSDGTLQTEILTGNGLGF